MIAPYSGYHGDYLIYYGSMASCCVWMIPGTWKED